MIYRQFKPADNLKNVIRCYWSLHGYAEEEIPYLVIPDYCMDILYSYPDNKALITGVSDEPYTIELKGDIRMFGIRFMPGAFYSIFNIPARLLYRQCIDFELCGTSFKLTDLFPENITDSHYLIRYLNSVFSVTDPKMNQLAAELITNSFMSSRKHSFLDNYSYKTFNRRLHEAVGLSYASYQNIVRFHKAVYCLLYSNNTQADAAVLNGYYDQPHWVKSIKSYSGFTPLQLNDEIKNNPVRFLQYPLGLF